MPRKYKNARYRGVKLQIIEEEYAGEKYLDVVFRIFGEETVSTSVKEAEKVIDRYRDGDNRKADGRRVWSV